MAPSPKSQFLRWKTATPHAYGVGGILASSLPAASCGACCRATFYSCSCSIHSGSAKPTFDERTRTQDARVAFTVISLPLERRLPKRISNSHENTLPGIRGRPSPLPSP